MSGATAAPGYALERRGTTRDLGDYVVGAGFAAGTPAFALADGSVVIAAGEEWPRVAVHDGGLLAFAAAGRFYVTGGEDGRLCRITPEGEASPLATFGRGWVEHVAARADDRGRVVVAAGMGKAVHVVDGEGRALKTLEHPSSVGGVCFDARGKRIAVAHYNGASLWFVAAKTDSPRRLEWKGSHIGIALSPDGDCVVTAMQENALHGWRLSEDAHMRMSGYPSKTRALSFTRNGKWLATSGAESVVLWPFFGGGPTGKAPTELAGGDNVLCTQVAAHTQTDMVAAGFSDGMVVLADIGSSRILPVAPPGRGPVSALAWSADGARLVFGTEDGFAAVVDFGRRD